jgi:hypothetical protein
MLFHCEHASRSCYTGARSMLDARSTSMARGAANNASWARASREYQYARMCAVIGRDLKVGPPRTLSTKNLRWLSQQPNVPLPSHGDDERSKMSTSCHPRPLSTLPRPKLQRISSDRHLLTPFVEHDRFPRAIMRRHPRHPLLRDGD